MSLSENLFILSQYILPHHPLSRLMGRFTHCRQPAFKNLAIRTVIRAYDVDMTEAREPSAEAYGCFNEFFTRALRPDARPLDRTPGTLVSPADGCVSQAGAIESGRIIQAKGKDYSARELLGGSEELAARFDGGRFATIYLSPRDYHRLHMPLAGTLREMIHVPGRLFSVNDATARNVPNLFARNERVVAVFDTEAGPMALVLVGAIFVASIETVWSGVVTPPTRATVQRQDYTGQSIRLERGAEMGRFNMGSTIVVLFGKDAVEWETGLQPGQATRVGQAIGQTRRR